MPAEYSNARKSLGDISSDSAEYQYMRRNRPIWDTVAGLIGEFPTVSGSHRSSQTPTQTKQIFYAANAVLNPSKFSISSIAILQQTATSMRWTSDSVVRESNQLARYLNHIRNIYRSLEVDNRIDDGISPYPSIGEKLHKGMSLEARWVCFVSELLTFPYHLSFISTETCPSSIQVLSRQRTL